MVACRSIVGFTDTPPAQSVPWGPIGGTMKVCPTPPNPSPDASRDVDTSIGAEPGTAGVREPAGPGAPGGTDGPDGPATIRRAAAARTAIGAGQSRNREGRTRPI